MVKRIKLGNGIYLNMIKTDKFKSNLLSYYFTRPLNRDNVTKNALLPLLLKRGNMHYQSNLEIEKELEEMYGANLSLSVNKRGEKHVLRFTMEWANGDYFNEPDLNYKVLDMLKQIVFEPYVEDDGFKADYVRQEKENLKNMIEGKINDKRSFAINRCIEEMCKYENFSLYQLGYVEDIPSINEINLYNHYKDIIDTSPIEIYYVGNFDDKLTEYLIENNSLERENIINITREKISANVDRKNNIEEAMDVNQGKLILGYRTGIPFENRKEYNGLLLASDILGGGPNSKLFTHVREEQSLAYYISSTVIKYKSLILIDSGIEFENYEKTVDIIHKQIEDLKSGIFDEGDMDISKKAIKTSTESIRDSLFLMAEFQFSQNLSKDSRNLEEVLKDFDLVTKEDIVSAANKIVLDTIYFMKNRN